MSGARLRSGKRLGKARIVEPGLKEKMTKEGSDMRALPQCKNPQLMSLP